MLLIFDTHDLNGALFLKDSFLSIFLFSSFPSTVVVPFPTIYASPYLHKSDLKSEVLNLIFF